MKKINKGQEIKHTLGYIAITVKNNKFEEKEMLIDLKNGSSAKAALIDKDEIIVDNIREYGRGFKRGHKIIGIPSRTIRKIKRVDR